MEKLLKEYIELMKQLRAANADLYVKFVEFARKAQQEFAQQYDLDGFGWIGATGWPPGGAVKTSLTVRIRVRC